MNPTTDHVRPTWQGIHHLALATRDLDAAVRFYTDVLGMTILLEPPAREGSPRHLFIDAGNGTALHLWEVPDAAIVGQPIEPGPPRFIPGALQHLALRLPDEAALEALQDRLRARGVEVTDLFSQGSVRLCFFHSPDGVTLEAACWVDDPFPARNQSGSRGAGEAASEPRSRAASGTRPLID